MYNTTFKILANSPPSSVPSLDTLQEIGNRLICSSITSDGWRTIDPRLVTNRKPYTSQQPTYVYAMPGPPQMLLPSTSIDSTKQWGQDLDSDETSDLDSILPFKHWDQPIPDTRATGQSQAETIKQSLWSLIPLPHTLVQPIMMPCTIVQPTFPSFSLRPSNILRPYSSHTPPTPELLLGSKWARCAWIVPIRGTLPWPCTSAALLDDLSTASLGRSHTLTSSSSNSRAQVPSLASGSNNTLFWTSSALRDFWEYLRRMRDKKQLGPLSISFCLQENKQKLFEGDLVNIDCFKLYTDAGLAMHVRQALHIWIFSPTTSTSMFNYQPDEGKIRLLKGSRLMLVDELNKAVLVC